MSPPVSPISVERLQILMKLSRTAAYALHATLRLAEAKSTAPTPCSKLASDGEMPERFLLQILRNLVNHGVLRSTRGVEGGYSLARTPQQISLLEILEAIEGPIGSANDVAELLPRNYRKAITTAMNQVSKNLRAELKAITIAKLMNKGR